MTNFTKVVDFNKSFGIPVSSVPLIHILKENPKLTNLRLSLIQEEVQELLDAFNQKDFVEVIDALTDILYVVYGAGASFGVNMDREFREYFIELRGNMDNNLSNYQIVKKYTKDNLDLEIPNTIINLFTTKMESSSLDNVYNTRNRISSYTQYLDKSIQEHNFIQAVDCLVRLLHHTYSLGILLGINLDQSYQIVHSSNMSKLCKTEEKAQETVEWYLKNEKRYDSPDYRRSDDNINWVVYNKSTGKILKSINYTPANFDIMLN